MTVYLEKGWIDITNEEDYYQCIGIDIETFKVVDKEEFDNLNELIDFSTEYCSSTLEDLQMELSNKVFEKLSCQNNLPITSLKEIIDITKILNERIVKV